MSKLKEKERKSHKFSIAEEIAYNDFIDSSEQLILAEYANRPFVFFNNSPVMCRGHMGLPNDNNLVT